MDRPSPRHVHNNEILQLLLLRQIEHAPSGVVAVALLVSQSRTGHQIGPAALVVAVVVVDVAAAAAVLLVSQSRTRHQTGPAVDVVVVVGLGTPERAQVQLSTAEARSPWERLGGVQHRAS